MHKTHEILPVHISVCVRACACACVRVCVDLFVTLSKTICLTKRLCTGDILLHINFVKIMLFLFCSYFLHYFKRITWTNESFMTFYLHTSGFVNKNKSNNKTNGQD